MSASRVLHKHFKTFYYSLNVLHLLQIKKQNNKWAELKHFITDYNPEYEFSKIRAGLKQLRNLLR